MPLLHFNLRRTFLLTLSLKWFPRTANSLCNLLIRCSFLISFLHLLILESRTRRALKARSQSRPAETADATPRATVLSKAQSKITKSQATKSTKRSATMHKYKDAQKRLADLLSWAKHVWKRRYFFRLTASPKNIQTSKRGSLRFDGWWVQFTLHKPNPWEIIPKFHPKEILSV